LSNELDPIAGTWYRHLDKGQMFVVVALDEPAGIVEVQHFDGDIEEIALGTWRNMELEVAEPPEDWTGPVDNVERDDTDYSATEMSSATRDESLEEYPPAAAEAWEDTLPEDECDDWGEGAPAEEMRPQASLEDSELASVGAEEPAEGEQE
jgi:hypothetical protein